MFHPSSCNCIHCREYLDWLSKQEWKLSEKEEYHIKNK